MELVTHSTEKELLNLCSLSNTVNHSTATLSDVRGGGGGGTVVEEKLLVLNISQSQLGLRTRTYRSDWTTIKKLFRSVHGFLLPSSSPFLFLLFFLFNWKLCQGINRC